MQCLIKSKHETVILLTNIFLILQVYPEGLRKALKWIKETCDDPEIFIMENGYSDNGEINDINRIQYLQVSVQKVL